jgi:hypothetical protein
MKHSFFIVRAGAWSGLNARLGLNAWLALSAWLLVSACGNPAKSPHSNNSEADSLAGKDSMANAFFPVGDYLRTEILHVDSLPVAITRFTVEEGRKDSAFISPPEFNKLAATFLLPEFGNGSFEKNYQESSFVDKTTRGATFTYSSADRTLPLKRVDVVTAPGRTSNQVRSIYLEKSFTAGDTAILQKMFWKAGRNFQIITQTTLHGKPLADKQLRVVWDTEEEEE